MAGWLINDYLEVVVAYSGFYPSICLVCVSSPQENSVRMAMSLLRLWTLPNMSLDCYYFAMKWTHNVEVMSWLMSWCVQVNICCEPCSFTVIRIAKSVLRKWTRKLWTGKRMIWIWYQLPRSLFDPRVLNNTSTAQATNITDSMTGNDQLRHNMEVVMKRGMSPAFS
jgi:hypothetical protein